MLGAKVSCSALARPIAPALVSRRPRKGRQGTILQSSREFHPSGKKEVLPIIGGALAVAAVATGLRYLVRAGESSNKQPGFNAFLLSFPRCVFSCSPFSVYFIR